MWWAGLVTPKKKKKSLAQLLLQRKTPKYVKPMTWQSNTHDADFKQGTGAMQNALFKNTLSY